MFGAILEGLSDGASRRHLGLGLRQIRLPENCFGHMSAHVAAVEAAGHAFALIAAMKWGKGILYSYVVFLGIYNIDLFLN